MGSAVLASCCDYQDLISISMSRSLHHAILSGNEEEVVTRLNMGEDVNQSFPPRYSSPLHTAVYTGNAVVVQLLLGRGADHSRGDKEGTTPLAIATSQGKKDIVTLLSKAGGTTTPPILPILDEKPDPLFSHPPPWEDQASTPVLNKEKVESVQPKESLYGFLKKGTKVMSSKPIKAVSDSNKKSVLEINFRKEEKIEICADKPIEKGGDVTVCDEKKITTYQPKLGEENGPIEKLQEETLESSNENCKQHDITKIAKGMYSTLEKKMSKTNESNKNENSQDNQSNTRAKFDKLQKNISSRLSKQNKGPKTTVEKGETNDKSKIIQDKIEKCKKFLSSDSNKQTIKDEKDKQDNAKSDSKAKILIGNISSRFSKSDKEKKTTIEEVKETKDKSNSMLATVKKVQTILTKSNPDDPSSEIQEKEKSEKHTNDKLKKLKIYKQQMFKNSKLQNTEEHAPSTIEPKIQNNFKSLKSYLTKKKNNSDEGSNGTKAAYNIKKLKFWETDGQEKSREKSNDKQKELDSKAPSTLKTIGLKLSNKGKTQKGAKGKGDAISNDKSKDLDNKDLMKNKFTNIFQKKGGTKEESQPVAVSFQKSEKVTQNLKDIQMRKRDTKYQWIMIDGQWRKSQSVGL